MPNVNHPICPMGVADTLGSCCIILVVLRCINSVTEYLLFVKQAGWVQKCKFFDKNLKKQLYFSFNWWQFAKNWRGLIIKCGLGQKWSKLWNQVPYLDHFVVQNSGDFLYWKYKEVVFMFQTWDNSQLLRRVLCISTELTIVSSLKHKTHKPFIFSTG